MAGRYLYIEAVFVIVPWGEHVAVQRGPLVVNHREIPAGLMVDEGLGFRRFAEAEFSAEAPPTVIRCDSYLAGAFRRGGEVWPVLSLKSLVESQSFMQAAS